MKKVYVAGPISKGDHPRNLRQAIDAGLTLLKLGYSPYVPHLDFLMALIEPSVFTYEIVLPWDLDWLKECDAVLRLPGESKGADIEEEFAYKHGIPVFSSLNDLLAALSA